MRALLLSVALLAMAGCTTLDTGVATAPASNRFADICRTAPAAHLAFTLLTANVTVSASVLDAERAAYAVVRTACANPPQDTAEALVALAEAYATVLQLQADVAAKQG